MNETNTKYLYNRFPDIFRDHDKPMDQTAMCWGFECDDGWAKILECLCEKLSVISKLTKIRIIAVQVKEKFGTGRFYYYIEWPKKINERERALWSEIIQNIITEWEMNQCAQTCEITGEDGQLCTKGGWLKTLCKKKAKELGFKIIK